MALTAVHVVSDQSRSLSICLGCVSNKQMFGWCLWGQCRIMAISHQQRMFAVCFCDGYSLVEGCLVSWFTSPYPFDLGCNMLKLSLLSPSSTWKHTKLSAGFALFQSSFGQGVFGSGAGSMVRTPWRGADERGDHSNMAPVPRFEQCSSAWTENP